MSGESTGLLPWVRLGLSKVYRTRVFDVLRQRSRSPRTGREHDFFVLEACDWVNVIPLTNDDEVVLIRQYRHGIEDFTLEIPGGMIDPTDASPQVAAGREMLEETGFGSDDIIPLGSIHPNPAIQANHCHTFLARGAEKRATPSFDGTEETEVVLEPLTRIPELIRTGLISHALVVVAFHWLELREEAPS
ncbi:MAG: NUDIX hydrolase [Candidatus Binatia bacterium]|nr:NUDIX hydrolase [Candidatus Binatia bacterium]